MLDENPYIKAFYDWEIPLRGWTLYNYDVELEPPFQPHWHFQREKTLIDDGKIPGPLSRLFKRKVQVNQEQEVESLHPNSDRTSNELVAFQVSQARLEDGHHSRNSDLLNYLSSSVAVLSFEVYGTNESIIVRFVCSTQEEQWLLVNLKSFYPQCKFDRIEDQFPLYDPDSGAIVDFGLSDEVMSSCNLFDLSSHDILTHLFRTCSGLLEKESILLQVIFKGVDAPWGYHLRNSVRTGDGSSIFQDDLSLPQIATIKSDENLFSTVLRIACSSESIERSESHIRTLAQAISQASRSATNSVFPLSNEGYDYIEHYRCMIERKSRRTGMLLSASELATFIHLPNPALDTNVPTWFPQNGAIPESLRNNRFILGTRDGDLVSVTEENRKRHTHLLGSTGVGKSTLLTNLILQDIQERNTVVLIDPHGDISDDVIARMPEDRLSDVVLIDPSSEEGVQGWNPLKAYNEQQKVVISSDLITAFRRESSSWGNVMHSVFANAVYTFLDVGSGTLIDLKRFIVEDEFRQSFVKNIEDEHLRYYWEHEFTLLKRAAIAPLLTRLDNFLRSKVIRQVVTAEPGLDFETCIQQRKIILAKLTQGSIGEENSRILGTILLSKIYQSILSRQTIPQSERHFVGLYVDECHNYITPTIGQLLSGGRKFGVGVHLAHQNSAQLTSEYNQIINSNTDTKLFFRLGQQDARASETLFTNISIEQFQNLAIGQAVLRVGEISNSIFIDTQQLKKVDDVILQHRLSEVSKIMLDRTTFKPVSHPKVKPKLNVIHKSREDKSLAEQASAFLQDEQNKKQQSLHRKIQEKLRKTGQELGFVSKLEVPVEGGVVDVSLERDNLRIAIEVSVYNKVEYEVMNIAKCLEAGYTTILCVSEDKTRLAAISESIEEMNNVHFFSVYEAEKYIGEQVWEQPKNETVIRGYKVKIKYEK
jgi:Type IV secretion-system coupling protein DNA-binding domain